MKRMHRVQKLHEGGGKGNLERGAVPGSEMESGFGDLLLPGLWCCSTERDTGSQKQPRVCCSRPFNTC